MARMCSPRLLTVTVSVQTMSRLPRSLLLAGLLLGSTNDTLAARPGCSKPDTSFQSFLSRFSEDVAFSSSRIVLPVVYRRGHFENGDPQVELWDAQRLQTLGSPLFMSRAQRGAR